MRKLLLAACATALVTASCASQGGVRVELDEWTVDPADTSAPAGELTFTAHNMGDVAHQLQVIRTSRPFDRLPVRKGVVRTDQPGLELVGEIPIVAKQETETLVVDLPAGSYALICNIASHYDNGMRAGFEAEASV
jgi:uncharacterized cupredoxin-like copper-binding protein